MTATGKARVAGVMGWPVDHSLSPRLHGFWLSAYGIDGAYVPYPVAPENLGKAMRALPVLGVAGVNLTVPHKEAAMAFVDVRDKSAERIGAINTIIVDPNGVIEGRNTDGFGFLESVRQGAAGVASLDDA